MKGFRQFLMRGNLIDLAVAVVIGSAFTAVVKAIVSDLITPLIAAIGGQPDFSGIAFRVHHSTFHVGDFVDALVSFVIVAGVIYFLIVAPMNKIMGTLNRHKAATERDCPECLSSIPVQASRCRHCTAVVTPVARPAQQ